MAMGAGRAAPSWLGAEQHFQNVPHGEVNWGALAQQWIRMRQAVEQSQEMPPPVPMASVAPPPHALPYDSPRPLFQPPQQHPVVLHQPHHMNQAAVPPFYPQPHFQQPTDVWQPRHRMDGFAPTPMRAPAFGPFDGTPWRPADSLRRPLLDSRPFFNGPPQPQFAPPPPPPHIAGRPPFAEPARQWPGDGAAFVYGSPRPHLAVVDQQMNCFPGYGSTDTDFRPMASAPWQTAPWLRADRADSDSPEMPLIGHQDRKMLPAWIREGLEKVEREKRRASEDIFAIATEPPTNGETTTDTVGGGDAEPSRSRFESDSDSADEGDASVAAEASQSSSKRKSRFDTPLEAPSADEVREQLMNLLKQLMTEILLETTGEQISLLSREVCERAIKRAQPKMIAQSSALAAISSFGGADDSDSGSDAADEPPAAAAAVDPFKRPSLPPQTSKARKALNAPAGDALTAAAAGEPSSSVISSGASARVDSDGKAKKDGRRSSSDKRRRRSRSREREERRRRRSRSPERRRDRPHSRRRSRDR